MNSAGMKLLWIFSLIQFHYVDLQSVGLRLDPPDDDGYIISGTSFTIQCEANDTAMDSQLDLMKDGISIGQVDVNESSTNPMEFSGVILYTIDDLQQNETGTYCCILDRVAAQDVDYCIQIQIIVTLEVNIIGDAFVENENELNLTCTASANPENVFVWTLNDEEIMEEQYDISFTAYTDNSINSSILMIRSINASIHKGIYKCTVNTTIGGIGEDMINVIVSPRGTVTTSPEVFIASQNNRGITFNCQTDAHQNSTVYIWLYNKNNFLCRQSDCPNRIFVFNRNDAEIINATVSISQTLNLNSITVSKGGEYVCVVSNDAGNGSSTSMLYIEPYFTVEPTDTEVDIGATFTLNCQAEAYPEVRMLQWQKLDNNSIEYADVNGEDGIEFTIDNALISDNGTYRCVASNSILGLVYVANSSTATVIVNGALSVNSSHYVSYIIMTVLLMLYSL